MNMMLKALVLCACVLAINCGWAPQENNENSTLSNLQQKFKTQVIGEDGPLNLINRLFKFFETTEKKIEDSIVNATGSSSNSTLSRNKRQYGQQVGYGAPQQGYGGYGQQQGGYGAPQGGYGGGGYGGGPAYPDVYPDGFDAFYTDEFLYDYYDWVCSETNCQLCNILTAECCDPAVNVNCFLPDSCLNNPCLSGGTCIPTRTIDNQYPDFICACLPGFTGKYCQLTNEFLLPPLEALVGGGDNGYGAPQGGYGGYGQQQGGYGAPSGYAQPQPNYGRPPQQGYAPQPAPYQPPQQQGYAPQPAPYQPPQQQGYAAPRPAPYQPPQQAAPAPYQAPPQQAAPAPYQAPQPQRSGPVAPSGGYGGVKTLSAKAGSFSGFDCNCHGKGTCAQVDINDQAEPEFFCICNDNTYGATCEEGFQNPCLSNEFKNMKAKFAPVDRKIPGYYFIECKTDMPYIRKCANGLRFNPKTGACQKVLQRQRPSFGQQQ